MLNYTYSFSHVLVSELLKTSIISLSDLFVIIRNKIVMTPTFCKPLTAKVKSSCPIVISLYSCSVRFFVMAQLILRLVCVCRMTFVLWLWTFSTTESVILNTPLFSLSYRDILILLQSVNIVWLLGSNICTACPISPGEKIYTGLS